jgi:hypothetical protein
MRRISVIVTRPTVAPVRVDSGRSVVEPWSGAGVVTAGVSLLPALSAALLPGSAGACTCLYRRTAVN